MTPENFSNFRINYTVYFRYSTTYLVWSQSYTFLIPVTHKRSDVLHHWCWQKSKHFLAGDSNCGSRKTTWHKVKLSNSWKSCWILMLLARLSPLFCKDLSKIYKHNNVDYPSKGSIRIHFYRKKKAYFAKNWNIGYPNCFKVIASNMYISVK